MCDWCVCDCSVSSIDNCEQIADTCRRLRLAIYDRAEPWRMLDTNYRTAHPKLRVHDRRLVSRISSSPAQPPFTCFSFCCVRFMNMYVLNVNALCSRARAPATATAINVRFNAGAQRRRIHDILSDLSSRVRRVYILYTLAGCLRSMRSRCCAHKSQKLILLVKYFHLCRERAARIRTR